MTILVNIMKYHMFIYIFSIDTINLRNKTLVFAHWAAGVIHTSLLMPASVKVSPVYPGPNLLAADSDLPLLISLVSFSFNCLESWFD